MTIELDGTTYNVFITRKNNKNMYLRVKSDGIYITCNYLVPKSLIINFIKNNKESVIKEYNRQQRKEEKKIDF